MSFVRDRFALLYSYLQLRTSADLVYLCTEIPQ